MTDFSLKLAVQNSIISAIYNWQASRTYTSSLRSREEGFTEHFGDPSRAASDNVWTKADDERLILRPNYPQDIVLFQFYPAWREQLALSIAGVPFAVVNSRFAVTESTGPLPYLRHFQPNGRSAVVGRLSRGNADVTSTGNSIFHYIQEAFHIDLDQDLSIEQKTSAKGFLSLIDKVCTYLCILRYQDWKRWDEVYRHQCSATGGGHFTFLQTHGERWNALCSLSALDRRMTATQAAQQARQVFDTFENHLALHKTLFLFATDHPTCADVALWSCLAECLADVNLVLVLAEYPALCKYAQHIWERYFERESNEWEKLNFLANAHNPFFQLPLLRHSSSSNDRQYQHAQELMDRLSLQKHNLAQQLGIAQQERNVLKTNEPCSPSHSGNKNMSFAQENELNNVKDHRNDEVWIVAIITSLLFFCFSYSPTTTTKGNESQPDSSGNAPATESKENFSHSNLPSEANILHPDPTRIGTYYSAS